MNTINILAMKIVNNNIIEYGVSASGVCGEKHALQLCGNNIIDYLDKSIHANLLYYYKYNRVNYLVGYAITAHWCMYVETRLICKLENLAQCFRYFV